MTKEKYPISGAEIEILAHRLLPEIKKFFADKEIQKEFEQWKADQDYNNHKIDKINYT